MSKLPNYAYQYQTSLYNNFNNELILGHNQGLALYNYDTDLSLYKNIDTKPLDNVNFDDINKRLDENDNLYNNAKATISGGINGVLEGTGKGLNNLVYQTLGGDNIKTYIGLFLLFLILFKKF